MSCSCSPESVLIVTPWLEGGGAQKSLAALMDRCKGVEFHVVTLFRGCSKFDEVESLSRTFTQLEEPRTPFGAVKARARMSAYLRHHRKIYSLMRGSHVVLGLGSAGAFKDKAMAGSLHQLPSSEGTGLVSRFEDKTLRRFTANADLITSPSSRAIEEALVRNYTRADRLLYEPNITKISRTATAPPRSHDVSVVRLVFAGRLTEQKGLDLLPELLSEVSIPVHLRILGDGPERQRLSNLYSSLSPHLKVEFVGYTDDVVQHIDWADAAFMPSRAELNPVFIHEAWSRGRPVLSSNIAAFADLEIQGPLYRAGSAADYAALIQRLVSLDDIRGPAFEHPVAPPDEISALEKFFRAA